MSDWSPTNRAFLILIVVLICLGMLFALTVCSIDGSKAAHHKAHDEGYEAGLQGLPPECCPYNGPASGTVEQHEKWKRGWQEGALERRKTAPQPKEQTP